MAYKIKEEKLKEKLKEKKRKSLCEEFLYQTIG